MFIRKTLHHIITVIAFLSIPLIWFSFGIVFSFENPINFMRSWNEYRLSGKPWGPLDI